MDTAHAPLIEGLSAAAYVIPTRTPEADGTLEWDRTTLVVVEVSAGSWRGLGYTYATRAALGVVQEILLPAVTGLSAFDIPRAWSAMVRAIRNQGRPGVSSMAIAAVDTALWDLKAKILDVSLADLLGVEHEAVPVYGSGGFTSYGLPELCDQLSTWVSDGITRVKMKIGARPQDDLARVKAARQAIGPGAELYVDANGAYSAKQAIAMAEGFQALGVSWFEEPVSSDHLDQLALIRARAPAQMEIAAGEYGYDSFYFRRMLEAGAVDVLQIDATRCAGITGFLRAAAIADGYGVPVSAHTAPSIHVAVCAAVPRLRHLEYFYDHARIEHALFDGALTPVDGVLKPDRSRPGLGLDFKWREAEKLRLAG